MVLYLENSLNCIYSRYCLSISVVSLFVLSIIIGTRTLPGLRYISLQRNFNRALLSFYLVHQVHQVRPIGHSSYVQYTRYSNRVMGTWGKNGKPGKPGKQEKTSKNFKNLQGWKGAVIIYTSNNIMIIY